MAEVQVRAFSFLPCRVCILFWLTSSPCFPRVVVVQERVAGAVHVVEAGPAEDVVRVVETGSIEGSTVAAVLVRGVLCLRVCM